jgi:F0F1-type ATP synthase assembly protein I
MAGIFRIVIAQAWFVLGRVSENKCKLLQILKSHFSCYGLTSYLGFTSDHIFLSIICYTRTHTGPRKRTRQQYSYFTGEWFKVLKTVVINTAVLSPGT